MKTVNVVVEFEVEDDFDASELPSIVESGLDILAQGGDEEMDGIDGYGAALQ